MSKKKLTTHQRKFIKEFIRNGGNASAAEAKVNPNHKTKLANRVAAAETLSSLNVQERIKAVHEKLGITDDMLGKVLKNGLNAKQTKIATFEGKIKDEKEYSDHPTRAKYLEIAHKLRGDMIEKHEISGTIGIREALKQDMLNRKKMGKK